MSTATATTAPGVAQTILTQLGGLMRLKAMIGVRQCVGDVDAVTLKFTARARNRANCVVITLDPSDTYTVRFCRIGGAPHFRTEERGETSLVYGDQLKAHIEAATGLALSL